VFHAVDDEEGAVADIGGVVGVPVAALLHLKGDHVQPAVRQTGDIAALVDRVLVRVPG